jgi:sugar lactone lactonase YvrE
MPTHRDFIRKPAAALLLPAVLVAAGLASPATSAATSAGTPTARPSLPGRIELPDGFQPEGIALRGGPTAYLGSRVDGDIYAADLRTGKGRVVSQGDGTPAIGLKIDRRGRLWVAGGPDGDAKVVNSRTGRVIAHYDFTSGPSFVNDVVLRGRAAWFTDSQRAALYRVTPRRGSLARAKVRTVPLSGAWSQVAMENNANGISTTPDGRALLVVQSATGYLFRVNPRTGRAVRVALGSTVLVNGDGLLRRGRTLFVVQNRSNKVSALRLGKHGRAARLVRTFTSASFDVPSTVTTYRGGLYLPNARFTTPAAPTTEYWITRVRR